MNNKDNIGFGWKSKTCLFSFVHNGVFESFNDCSKLYLNQAYLKQDYKHNVIMDKVIVNDPTFYYAICKDLRRS